MSYSLEELRGHPAWRGLSAEAREFLAQSLLMPSRDVGSGGFAAVSGAFPSRKVGASIPFESRSAELALAVHMEFDADVLAFYNQLPPVEVRRTRKGGGQYPTSYTADFLVIRKDELKVVQVKTEKELRKLVETRSADWTVIEGCYVDTPASEAFRALGLAHEVVSTQNLDRYRTANYRLLLRSRLAETVCDDQTRAKARAELKAKIVVSLAELAKALGSKDLSPLLQLIDEGELVVDLERSLISSPETCWVSTDRQLLETHRAEWLAPDPAGWALASEIPSEKRARRALEIIDKISVGHMTPSVRRWQRKIQAGKAMGLSVFKSALPNWQQCGNRKPKRPDVVKAFAENVIRDRWGRAERPAKRGTYGEYRLLAKAWHPGLKYVSKPTFLKLLKELEVVLSRRRSGARGENAASPPTAVADRVIVAMRPFEQATCDHYMVDLSCVVAEKDGKRYTKRPIFTVLRDIATGMVLAFWLSFAKPSRVACACVLRSCLRRWGRLPESIIVDRGAEFLSVYFRSLLASLEIELVLRPSAHPRYGSEAERIFGQLKERWLDGRPGNSTDIKEVRSVSGSHRPQATAELTVLDLLNEIDHFLGWFARWGTNHSHRAPQYLFDEGLTRFPFSGRQAVYGPEFEILSAVDVSSFALDPRRGIKIHPYWYWAPELADLNLKKGKVLVRKDPENPYTVYALVHEKWVPCQSSRAQRTVSQTTLQRMAEAVLGTAPNSQLDDAIEDAESDLVIQKRCADERSKARKDVPPETRKPAKSKSSQPAEDAPVSKGEKSIWAQLRSLNIDAAPSGTWSKS
ncbi:hypothetical protein C7S18_17730 [Ahniella affigens]|uniref:Integrase catalytic domain-containing protein n=1 Tax=Ahniella affigens TaxID=2021234 RepID=A0A2P1PVM6_9GAMM|nr:DDE-type integrase/transposase/recombinase [Ahniella affigens]AVP98905.1 hypothetical protein C7S18_17730 [Ahniella affigens]